MVHCIESILIGNKYEQDYNSNSYGNEGQRHSDNDHRPGFYCLVTANSNQDGKGLSVTATDLFLCL